MFIGYNYTNKSNQFILVLLVIKWYGNQDVFLNLFGNWFGCLVLLFPFELLSLLTEIRWPDELLFVAFFLSAFDNLIFDLDLLASSFFLAYDRVKMLDLFSFFYLDLDFSLFGLF